MRWHLLLCSHIFFVICRPFFFVSPHRTGAERLTHSCPPLMGLSWLGLTAACWVGSEISHLNDFVFVFFLEKTHAEPYTHQSDSKTSYLHIFLPLFPAGTICNAY